VNFVLPEFVRLNGDLFTSASPVWDGRSWEKNPACEGELNLTPRYLWFFMGRASGFTGGGATEALRYEATGWAEAGYRVANHLEVVAYAMANPDDQRAFGYTGFGTFVANGSAKCIVPYVHGTADVRHLSSSRAHDLAHTKDIRQLLVQEVTS